MTNFNQTIHDHKTLVRNAVVQLFTICDDLESVGLDRLSKKIEEIGETLSYGSDILMKSYTETLETEYNDMTVNIGLIINSLADLPR